MRTAAVTLVRERLERRASGMCDLERAKTNPHSMQIRHSKNQISPRPIGTHIGSSSSQY
jgi:hypothetical protein